MAAGEKKQAGNELAAIDAEVLQIESLYRGFEPEETKQHLVNLQRDSATLTGEIERMRSSFADMQQELGKLPLGSRPARRAGPGGCQPRSPARALPTRVHDLTAPVS